MIHPTLEDTIAAIVTPNGVGAISVIRVSGTKAISSAGSIFKGKRNADEFMSHTVYYGEIVDKHNEIIDDVLLTIFRAPNSYTGEDAIEISYHGNPLIGQKIMKQLLELGVRVAEPGEFTKRAFLNNKIDLAQAEAVADVISSRSEASLRGARNQLDGRLSSSVSYLRNSLLNTLSFLELELDFVDENIELVKRDDLQKRIILIIQKIDDLLTTYSYGRVIRDGVNVVLVGKPNVGKSSLLNYFLKESRVIVSEIPGTTRDVIREEIAIDGILFKLFDTAGIRKSNDAIEKEGVRRSNDAIKSADIILFINDVEQGVSEDLFVELLRLATRDRIIKVINKIDLGLKFDTIGYIGISALTGFGINELIEIMKKNALGNVNYTEQSAVVSNIRHFQCLNSAKESLAMALSSINQNMSGEFVALDIRKAIDSLGEIIGEITSEDVLNNIFSKFCIGK